MIRKVSGGWRVVARSGRNMGTYARRSDAEHRLRQVEAFANLSHSPKKRVYEVKASTGRVMGRYATREEAEKRVAQLEATAVKFFTKTRGYTVPQHSTKAHSPKCVPGTRVRFGQEKTRAQALARAKWERRQAHLFAHEPIIADAHLRTAVAYEQLAASKAHSPGWHKQPLRHAKAAKLGRQRHQRRYSHSPMSHRNLLGVRAANAMAGHHFFERATMRFFNSRVVSGLYRDRYFITAERMDDRFPYRYSIRSAEPDGSIDTVGKFQGYATKKDARDAIERL